MGYSYYEIGGMKRGYAVNCKCHFRGCKEKIDRGLAYLCYACSWYFCGKHLTWACCEEHDEMITAMCFAGEGEQLCIKCAKELEKLPPNECHPDHSKP